MNPEFLQRVYRSHQDCVQCPSQEQIVGFFDFLLGLLFPSLAREPYRDYDEMLKGFESVEERLHALMITCPIARREEVCSDFREQLPVIYELLLEDAEAICSGDPAANSVQEVIRSYPGFYAIAAYRIAHSLLGMGVPNIPRSIAEHAHSKTGIDIHPGARIGRRFCIDHGTGVVIGETTEIGNDVKIYQGVTLGALSVRKEMARKKRHPTVEDGVVIYSGATILGGNTVIGAASVIGGNVWLTRSVPPASKVYYEPGANQYNPG